MKTKVTLIHSCFNKRTGRRSHVLALLHMEEQSAAVVLILQILRPKAVTLVTRIET